MTHGFRRPVKTESGFSLLEIVIACGIFALAIAVAAGSLSMAGRLLGRSAVTGETSGAPALERFAALLREASASSIAASAVSGPATPYGDVRIVLFAQDDAGNGSYTAFAQSPSGVFRLDYGTAVPGSVPPRYVQAVPGVTALSAQNVSADSVAAAYGLAARNQMVPLAPGAAGAAIPVTSGNGVVAVRIGNGAGSRSLHLAGGVLPSGFTVTGTPVIHAIVYRVDNPPQCVRVAGFCVGSRTTANIYGRVSVSYTDGATWRVWCPAMMLHPDVYVGPDGFFTDAAPDASYRPDDPAERTSSLVRQCRRSAPEFPGPRSTDPPAAFATPAPIVYETAPPAGTLSVCAPDAMTASCLDPAPPPD